MRAFLIRYIGTTLAVIDANRATQGTAHNPTSFALYSCIGVLAASLLRIARNDKSQQTISLGNKCAIVLSSAVPFALMRLDVISSVFTQASVIFTRLFNSSSAAGFRLGFVFAHAMFESSDSEHPRRRY